MKNVLYRKVVVPATKSPDGESPSVVTVTEEVNGFAVFFESYDDGTNFLEWFRNRDEAIEYGVDHATSLIREQMEDELHQKLEEIKNS